MRNDSRMGCKVDKGLRGKIYRIIFEADTIGGKFFDIALIIVIIMSIVSIMVESISEFGIKYHILFRSLEWGFTIVFTIEYILRTIVVKKPLGYTLSFFGIIDILSFLPTYLGIFFSGIPSILFLRSLRLLRLFRILKLGKYIKEGKVIITALKASMYKINVFLISVLTTIIIIAGFMYFIEGPESGFTSIPRSMYWTIVTLTTVGYGDIAPQSPLGQFLASVVMILGYSIIAVPTGIYTVEITKASKKAVSTRVCPYCLAEDHNPDSNYCYHCGKELS